MCFEKVWAVSDNGSTGALHVSGKSSILLRSTKFLNASLVQLDRTPAYEAVWLGIRIPRDAPKISSHSSKVEHSTDNRATKDRYLV